MLSCAPGIACVCLAAFGAYLGGCLLVPTRHGRPTTAPRELRLGPTRGGPGAMDATGSWRMCAPRMGISSSASKSASRFASRRGGLHRSWCKSGCGSARPQPDGAPTAAKRTVAATQQAGVGLEILGGPTPGPSRSMPEQFLGNDVPKQQPHPKASQPPPPPRHPPPGLPPPPPRHPPPDVSNLAGLTSSWPQLPSPPGPPPGDPPPGHVCPPGPPDVPNLAGLTSSWPQPPPPPGPPPGDPPAGRVCPTGPPDVPDPAGPSELPEEATTAGTSHSTWRSTWRSKR